MISLHVRASKCVVFLAELGDKTQLVALGLGARSRLGPVLAGVALGYVVATTLSVAIGAVLGAALPTAAVQVGGGLAFLGFAIWALRGGEVEAGEEERGTSGQESTAMIVLHSGVALFIAELGDAIVERLASSYLDISKTITGKLPEGVSS